MTRPPADLSSILAALFLVAGVIVFAASFRSCVDTVYRAVDVEVERRDVVYRDHQGEWQIKRGK